MILIENILLAASGGRRCNQSLTEETRQMVNDLLQHEKMLVAQTIFDDGKGNDHQGWHYPPQAQPKLCLMFVAPLPINFRLHLCY